MSEALTDTTAPTTAAPDGAVVVSGAQDTAAPAPAAGGAPEATGTLLTSEPADKPVVAPADWPEDWRYKFAGDDKAYLKTLERYSSPADLAKAHRELQQRQSRGELKPTLKSDATPEEIAAWRKEAGLPEKPEEYQVSLPQGMIPGEADKPLIDWFQKAAHRHNMHPEQFNGVLGEWYAYQDELKAQAFEADRATRSEAEDALRAEWGAAYRSEVRGIANFMEANAPPGLSDELFNARTPDGKLLGDHPNMLKFLSTIVRQINPMATLVPAGSADVQKAGESRISEIEQAMKSDPQSYWKNQSMQDEYGKLLEAREAMKGRAA